MKKSFTNISLHKNKKMNSTMKYKMGTLSP